MVPASNGLTLGRPQRYSPMDNLMKALRKFGFVLAVVFIGGQLYAQPTPAPDRSAATSAEAREQVEAAQAQVKEDNRHVLRLQALARREKDVIKLSCVNDSMVRIKAQTNIFEDKVALFEATPEGGDWSSTFAEVTSSADSVRKSRDDADRCVGDIELSESESTYGAPELVDDPTQVPPYSAVIEPPAYASPFS